MVQTFSTPTPIPTEPDPSVAPRTVIVADCDHPSIAIEQQVLADICPSLAWLACRTEDEIIASCADGEGLLIQYAPMTRRVLEQLPRCKVIVRYGVGVDTVDLGAAHDLGIVVSNVPDYGTHEVADHALALMLCLTRKIERANRLVKTGQWDFRLLQPVRRHAVSTMGIVGVGRIGSAMALRAHALGMKVLGCDPYVAREHVPACVALVDLATLLRESDVVSLHCPLTDETRGMFDAGKLALMRPSAYLVNTARGSIVDEPALAAALAGGRLAGAAMDVLKSEPGKPDHPLFAHENFLCTPHMAWHSNESAQELKRKAAEEVRRVLLGQPPHYRVNGI